MRQDGLKEALFDEVFDSQKNFRILMEGMSRPGEVFKLPENNFKKTPQGFNSYLLSILKTLGDNNVTFALGNMENGDIREYIEVNTGMNPAPVSGADYVMFDGNEFDKEILSLKTGSLEYPESGAMVLAAAGNILSGLYRSSFMPATAVHMQGPGIKNENIVTFSGLSREYFESIAELNSAFPLGVDVIFVDKDGNIACVSRTTKLEVR